MPPKSKETELEDDLAFKRKEKILLCSFDQLPNVDYVHHGSSIFNGYVQLFTLQRTCK